MVELECQEDKSTIANTRHLSLKGQMTIEWPIKLKNVIKPEF